MRDVPGPTFAFVGWNPFQILRFDELARALPGAVMVVERRRGALHEISDETLAGTDVPCLVWDSERLHELDGELDVVVCQTAFPGLERFEKSKVAMLQYGLAKEPHNHGTWRSLADLCLVYGPYTANKLEGLCPVAIVGNPHFDRWGTAELERSARQRYARRLDATRKTVLYVPTWGDLSTQDHYTSEIVALAEQHNVLVKLHHNTHLFEHDRAGSSSHPHVHVFGASDDLLALLAVSDVVLSDYSGAIFDALYCEKPVILLQRDTHQRFGHKLDAQSLEHAEQARIGPVVADPRALRAVVSDVLSGRVSHRAQNRELVERLFVPSPGATERARDALLDLARGRTVPASADHLRVRAAERAKHGATPRAPAHGLRGMERRVLEAWMRDGHHGRVLRYVELRLAAAPKIYLYRVGLRAARALGEAERAARLLEGARRHFPDHRVGQVAEADLSAKRGVHARDESPARGVAPAELSRTARQVVAGALGVALRRVPHGVRAPVALAHGLEWARQREAAVSLLSRLPEGVSVERALSLARIARRAGDHVGAYRTLALAQRHHAGEPALLLHLANALIDDGRWLAAEVLLALAARRAPDLALARLLFLRNELHGRSRRASEQALALLPAAALTDVLGSVQRAGAGQPESRPALAEARRRARAELLRRARRPGVGDRDRALGLALDCGLLDEARRIGSVPSSRLSRGAADRRLARVEAGLGPLAPWIQVAWHNEDAADLRAVDARGNVAALADGSPAPTVEVFIPHVFFAHGGGERPVYEVARATFRAIAGALLERGEVRVVPRLQLHPRRALPRTVGPVISHQTHHEGRRPWLHVHEAPLPGLVALDTRGHAGFASLARDFSAIETATSPLSLAQLEETQRALHARFVVRNQSKHPQPPRGPGLPTPYVFVALQVVSDEVAELAQVDALTLLRTVATAAADSGVSVVVKRHPFCRSVRVQKTIDELARAGLLRVSSASVHDLIAGAEAVYTVSSAVGLEALLHLKPVVVTGQCEYRYAVSFAGSPSELAELVRARPSLDRVRALRFLHFYCRDYLVEGADAHVLGRRVHGWLDAALQATRTDEPGARHNPGESTT